MLFRIFCHFCSILFVIVNAIPGKMSRFYDIDNADTEWSWVGRLSERYKFNAEAQKFLHRRLVNNYSHSIPKAPAMFSPSNPISILFWETEGFEDLLKDSEGWTADCPVPCKVTSNRTEINQAHMIVNTGEPFPSELKHLKKYQQKVLFNLEPDLSLPDVKARLRPYDLLVSYSHLSDIVIDYTRSLIYPNANMPNLIKKKNNDAMAFAFVSNCGDNGDAKYRMDYLRELSVHMPIHFYGSCLHTPGLSPNATFEEVADNYYFALVFENTILDDYVTDKFYKSLATTALPVYMGAPNIAEYLPDKHSNRIIVEARQYPDPANLAAYLKSLIRDEEEYLEFFAWRDQILDKSFSPAHNYENKGPESFVCRMCQLYNDRVEK